MKSAASLSLLLLSQTTTASHLRRGVDVFSSADDVYASLSDNSNDIVAKSVDNSALPRFKKLTPLEATIPACVECEEEKKRLENANSAVPAGPYFSNKNAVFNPKWGSHGHWKWLNHAGDGDTHHSALMKQGHTIEKGDNYGQADPYEHNMWSVKAVMTIEAEEVPDIHKLTAAIAASADVDRRYISIRGVHRGSAGNSFKSPESNDLVSDSYAAYEEEPAAEEPVAATGSDASATGSGASATGSDASATGSVEAAGSSQLTQTQVIIGQAVVEKAVDSAKGEIGSLVPEGEIEKQETKLQTKLERAEQSLATTTEATTNALSPTQVLIGGVVEKAVESAKGEIGSLMPIIESEIEKQESELETKLERAEQSLAGNMTSTRSHENPIEELKGMEKTMEELSKEIDGSVGKTALMEESRSLMMQHRSKSKAAPAFGQCLPLEHVPGCSGAGVQYRSGTSHFAVEKYDVLKNTIVAARPFSPILQPMLGGCSLDIILEHACLVLFPPCDGTCSPKKASVQSCEDFNSKQCLTDDIVAQLRPQAGMAQSLLPPGTDINMLFDVFDQITKCSNEKLFVPGGVVQDTPALATCDASSTPPAAEEPSDATVEKREDDVMEEKDAEKDAEKVAEKVADGPSATQKSMGTVVEKAVDNAKGEIGPLVPKIEGEIIKHEEHLSGELDKAEEGLTGEAKVVDEDKEEKKTEVLTSTQKMMGTVVESAVDKAKGEIGSLIPTIENEIVKQEKGLEEKLDKAERSLTGQAEGATGIIDTIDVNDENLDDAMAKTPTASQVMIGKVVESAVDNAKGEIGSLIPKIEDAITKQEGEMEEQLKHAESSLLRQTFLVTFVIHEETRERAEDVIPTLNSKKAEVVLEAAIGNGGEMFSLEMLAITPPQTTSNN